MPTKISGHQKQVPTLHIIEHRKNMEASKDLCVRDVGEHIYFIYFNTHPINHVQCCIGIGNKQYRYMALATMTTHNDSTQETKGT